MSGLAVWLLHRWLSCGCIYFTFPNRTPEIDYN
ncbi:Protein of unknown function [Pyronema omphalodes CBS 100304]|uniref:Uncharacterized protein n=1 Tax=Pyronema omphalodes (strain CBS 100304) TaxID=1076935 RepID=U4LHH9_PYROM|nr:Protein of unknown function [Pyronema omphalodes CBS 100304]